MAPAFGMSLIAGYGGYLGRYVVDALQVLHLAIARAFAEPAPGAVNVPWHTLSEPQINQAQLSIIDNGKRAFGTGAAANRPALAKSIEGGGNVHGCNEFSAGGVQNKKEAWAQQAILNIKGMQIGGASGDQFQTRGYQNATVGVYIYRGQSGFPRMRDIPGGIYDGRCRQFQECIGHL